MEKIIMDFSDIKAGWMRMHIYDYINQETRQMRISYIQKFFDDLLMACKFLLSDITGVYETYIDQEGFEAKIRLHKYRDDTILVEIVEDFFEDEIPYGKSQEEWDLFINQEAIPTTLTYFGVNIRRFVLKILELIDKYQKDYNEGFALTPTDQLNEELFNEVCNMSLNKYFNHLSGGEDNEEISNP